jgi:hypothetical protein
MWKRIDISREVTIGDIITDRPGTENFFEVVSVKDGYVKIIHTKSKFERIFPEIDLVTHSWWVKE